jgi:Glycosyl transferases group 1
VRTVYFIVPDGVDNPSRPSGGNTYDRRVSANLSVLGWSVVEHGVPGAWPEPSESALVALTTIIGAIPDRAVVLIDGLIASAVPEVFVPQAERLRLVVLVHMPLGQQTLPEQTDNAGDRERRVLTAASAVVTTSDWTRRRLGELYGLRPEQIRVCRPGTESAAVASGTTAGGALLCVAAIIPGKGHDVLIDALATVADDLGWHCVCVGALDRNPDFVAGIGRQTRRLGLDDRISFPGPCVGADLDHIYEAADVVTLASRAETYGMVLTEALAHGLPVIATNVGGVPEAVGGDERGLVPGILCPPDDPIAFGQALRSWLSDPSLRSRLRQGARERRATLAGWDATASALGDVLTEAAA